MLHNFFLQFDEQRDQVAIEQILRVIFVDLERPSPVRLHISNMTKNLNHFIICSYNWKLLFM